MILSARFKTVLVACGVVVTSSVFLVALFISIKPFMRSYRWNAPLQNQTGQRMPNTMSTSTQGMMATSSGAALHPSPELNQRQRIEALEWQVQSLSDILLGPRSTDGRVLINDSIAGFLYSQETNVWDWSKWNTDDNPAEFRPVVIEKEGYALTVPVNPRWGDDRFTFHAYDEYQDVTYQAIGFGPLYIGNYYLGGMFRAGRFYPTPKRSIQEALNDPENVTGRDCGNMEGRRPSMSDVVRIGDFQALRIEGESCEGAWEYFEVFGKNTNYIFGASSQENDTLLRWTIERFQEK